MSIIARGGEIRKTERVQSQQTLPRVGVAEISEWRRGNYPWPNL